MAFIKKLEYKILDLLSKNYNIYEIKIKTNFKF